MNMSEEELYFLLTEKHFLLTKQASAYTQHLTNKAEALQKQANLKLHYPQQIFSSVAGLGLAFGMYKHFVRYQGYRLLGFTVSPVPWAGMSACIAFMGYFGYTYGSIFFHDTLVGKKAANEIKNNVRDAFGRRDGFVEMSKSYQDGSIQAEWKKGLYK